MYDPSEEPTLTQILADLQARGYTFDFGKEKSDVFMRKVMLAQQRRPQESQNEADNSLTDLYIREYHRLEGMSDPSENMIVYALETREGIKGYLVNAYGIYSEDKQAEKEAVTPQEIAPENTYDNSVTPVNP